MLTNKTFYGLLGSLVMAAGLPASASDKESGTAESASQREESKAESSEDTVRIVVSLPNGRKYVIEQKADPGARSDGPLGTRVSRVLPDGSRISYGTGLTSSRSAARSRGTAGTRRAGGGSVNSAGRSSLTGAGGGGLSTTARLGGGGGGGASAASGGGGSAGTAAAPAGGGGMRAPHQRHVGSDESASKSAASAPGTSGRSAQPGRSGGSGTNTGGAKQPVSTIGSPRYDDNGATGGQDVTFHDAGISAMVIGRTVYIWGADIVQSTVDFGLIEGERMAFDGAVVHNHRNAGGGEPLTSADQMFAPLKLEFGQGETVTLTMHSRADNQDNPSREIRNWTFRVR